MKHLLEEILEALKNKGYHYYIECDGLLLQDITNDPTLCHSSRDNPYQGVNAVDECDIVILKRKKDLPEQECNAYQNEDGEWITQKDFKNISFIRWTNFNDGRERLWDYGVRLETIIDLDELCDDWEERLNRL
tara:strand:- start:1568 stop:1966 length:399 start_codon:yes stop_codon:yes gene_type:complete